MSKHNPLVSIVMTVYNDIKYIEESINSILNQTYKNFEFIIIDDASTDGTQSLLKQYSITDNRLKVIYNKNNIGFIRSLNKGFKHAKGKYIARQDADDISLPKRLETQVRYLENNQNIGLCGTWIKIIDHNGRFHNKIKKHPSSPYSIQWNLSFFCCIAHSSVMIRTTIIDKNGAYNPKFQFVEDYELWVRLSKTTLLANIPKFLVLYREHGLNISTTKTKEQEQGTISISKQSISEILGIEVPESLIIKLNRMTKDVMLEKTDMKSIFDLIMDLYQIFIMNNSPNQYIKKEIAEEAANKLILLAFRNVCRWPFESCRVIYRAIELDRNIFFKCFFKNFYKILK